MRQRRQYQVVVEKCQTLKRHLLHRELLLLRRSMILFHSLVLHPNLLLYVLLRNNVSYDFGGLKGQIHT